MTATPQPPTAPLPPGLGEHRRGALAALSIGLVVVSDARTELDDETTPRVRRLLALAGHALAESRRVANSVPAIQAVLVELIADPALDGLLFSGGTGFSPRDRTVEAIAPRFERGIDGFGELFRWLSFQEIGAAAMISRAAAGIVAGKPVFLLPGSPQAVSLALERLILPELGHLVAQLRRPA